MFKTTQVFQYRLTNQLCLMTAPTHSLITRLSPCSSIFSSFSLYSSSVSLCVSVNLVSGNKKKSVGLLGIRTALYYRLWFVCEAVLYRAELARPRPRPALRGGDGRGEQWDPCLPVQLAGPHGRPTPAACHLAPPAGRRAHGEEGDARLVQFGREPG